MKPVSAHSLSIAGIAFVVVLVVGAGLLFWLHSSNGPGSPKNPVTSEQISVTTNAPQSGLVIKTNSPSSAELSRRETLYSSFQKRPFPVAYESATVQWTLADGKDTNVIRQLAHNELEYDRMVEENPRIFRRQLVYLKQTAAAVFEQAKLTGQPVKQLTLPGVDGQELQFEIVSTDSSGSSRHGMFSGHLAGDDNSMVTMAFQDGREAFTVLSPKKNIYVVGEPREPGQVIVKAIDPNTYGVGPMESEDEVKTGTLQK